MKRVVCAALVLLIALPARADGDGSGVLPLGSPGGLISGTIIIHPDGSFTFTGTYGSVPIGGYGKVGIGQDGKSRYECELLVGWEQMKRRGGAVPKRLEVEAEGDEGIDGDPTDDDVGALEVEGGTLGNGKIPLKA